ncbi:MAG: T9SS type A sorting domain-containing protein [Flavobacteriales bacterium]|nr:T9SS type A sorting domain-containing protein [Flavobacteriales bacterium]
MIIPRSTYHARCTYLLGACIFAGGSLFAQDGVLDITFSGDGQYGFMPQIPDVITTEILETNGDIFAFLTPVNGTTSSYIIKMNENGSLISDFGQGGILELQDIGISDAVIAADGEGLLLLISDTDGFLIGTMGLNGAMAGPWMPVTTPEAGAFAKMLVDDQGRIVIGISAFFNGDSFGQVLRLQPDLSPDISFGINGTAQTPDSPFCFPLMEIDRLGRIVLGSSQPGCGSLWRFNTDGTLDDSFDYTLDLMPFIQDSWIIDLAVAPDNSIYLQPNTYGYASYLFKLQENGSVDTNFGMGGHIILEDPEPQWYTAPDELLIEPGGGLIVMAPAYLNGSMQGKWLARLDASGALDPDFNPGIQPIDDQGYELRLNFHCASLQADGKVLSMDQVGKWQGGNLLGWAPLITRFTNEKGAVGIAPNDEGPRVEQAIAYPNPTQGVTTLRATGHETWQQATVVITSTTGAVVLEGQLVNGTIDVSTLAGGVYTCRVRHADGSVHSRIVKE